MGLADRAWKCPSGILEEAWARAPDSRDLSIKVTCIKTTAWLEREFRKRREIGQNLVKSCTNWTKKERRVRRRDLRRIGGNRISQSRNTSEEISLIQPISVVEQTLRVRLDLDAGDTVVSKAQQVCSQSSHSAKECWLTAWSTAWVQAMWTEERTSGHLTK